MPDRKEIGKRNEAHKKWWRTPRKELDVVDPALDDAHVQSHKGNIVFCYCFCFCNIDINFFIVIFIVILDVFGPALDDANVQSHECNTVFVILDVVDLALALTLMSSLIKVTLFLLLLLFFCYCGPALR